MSPGKAPAPIGTATMLADSTLVLDLTADTGQTRGIARVTYPPDHPRHAAVLQHLGGMKPGQSKPVPPWPDAIDDQKVEQSVRSWVAKQRKWDPPTYRVEITGTDGEKNIAVTVHHRGVDDRGQPGPWEMVALRLSPKTYEVVSANGGDPEQ